jgi:hypothetical protein
MRNMIMGIAAILALGVSGTAEARKKAGVEMPDSIAVNGKSLALNGMGVREATVFNVDVYVAGLYLEKTSQDPDTILNANQTMRLHMKFVHDVDREDLVDAMKGGFKNNNGDVTKLEDRIDKLVSWLSGMDDGHTMTFTFIPGKGTEVIVKGTTKGTIEGDDFGKALFRVWLGPKPPNAGLKKGLLGK